MAESDGVVEKVTAEKILLEEIVMARERYSSKFARSNQITCINQHPIVEKGEKVKREIL